MKNSRVAKPPAASFGSFSLHRIGSSFEARTQYCASPVVRFYFAIRTRDTASRITSLLKSAAGVISASFEGIVGNRCTIHQLQAVVYLKFLVQFPHQAY